MPKGASRSYLAIETATFFAVNNYAAFLAGLAAAALGLALPDMPLLRHTYIAFATVVLLMVWLSLRGEGLARFGLIRPRWRDIAFGLALVAASIALDSVVRSITTPLIVAWTGANPHLDQQTFAALQGDLGAYLIVVPCAWLFAGLGEEFLFRGYLLTRLAEIFGGSRIAWGLAIVGQAIAFALAHWYQGPVGMVPIGIGAVLTGIVTTAWGRNLWPAIIAHSLIDTLGFTLLYLGKPIN